MDSAPDWDNLATWLVRARGERTQQEMADMAGASARSVQAWEAGTLQRPGRMLRAYAAKALRWTPDSLDVVLAGGEPTIDPWAGMDDPPTDEELAALKAVADGRPVRDTDMAALARMYRKLTSRHKRPIG